MLMTVKHYDTLDAYVIIKESTVAYSICGTLNPKISAVLTDLLPHEAYFPSKNGVTVWHVGSDKQVLIYESILDITKNN